MTLLEYPALIYEYLIDIVNNEDATAKELIILATSIGIFWHIFVLITKPIVNYFTYDTLWLRRSTERDYEHNLKQLYEDWGIKKSKEETIDEGMKEWPTQIICSVQHFVGGRIFQFQFLVSIVKCSTLQNQEIYANSRLLTLYYW